MKHHYLPYIFLLALIVIGMGAWYNYRSVKPTTTQNTTPNTTKPSQSVVPTKNATLTLSAPQTTVVGTPVPLSIRIMADALPVAGVSLRVTYPFTTLNFQVPAHFTVANKLVSAKWNSVINSISVDQQKKTVTMDLALILLDPKGYIFSNNEEIATVSLIPQAKGQATFTFDLQQARVAGKTNDIFGVKGVPATISVQ